MVKEGLDPVTTSFQCIPIHGRSRFNWTAQRLDGQDHLCCHSGEVLCNRSPSPPSMAARTLANTHASPLASHIAQLLSTASSITSFLQTLNPQNPTPNSPTSISPLSQFAPFLNPNLVIQVIKSQKNPYHALFFFNWASNPNPNPNNYSHSHLCYVAITDLLISHGLFSTASSLLQSHHRLSDFTAAKFVKAYGDRGDIRGAIHWFHRAKKMESGRCLFSYNAILGVFVKANRIMLARAVFDQIVKEGVVKPDVSTYTTIIRGYCKMGMIENAKNVFDEMGCKPNLVTYNTMINGFCKKGLMESAMKIVDQMTETEDCMPDTVTYTTLIDGYCKRGELEEAMKYMEEMVSRNCEPNVLTYNAIIYGLCLNGNVDEAKRMMTRMRLNGLKDNVATHTSILKGLCVVGKLDDAARHLKEMVGLGMEADAKAYGVVVNEYCKIGKADDAISLLKEMKSRGINPSVSSFNAVFRILVESGKTDKAGLILRQMKQLGCTPNFLSYSTVIDGLCKAKGRMHEVEEFVDDMCRNGHHLDASMYSWLVKGYCEDGNADMAMRLFCEMLDMGYVINLESFLAFVKGLSAKEKAFEVEKFFEEMSRRCPGIDIHKYRRILDEHLCKNLGNGRREHQQSTGIQGGQLGCNGTDGRGFGG